VRELRYASVCDGIGAAHQAWYSLGWRCAWTSEIEPLPAAIVEHHWKLPNVGDMLNIERETIEQYGSIELLVGGTPCQSFSVAGLRGGLDDPRGNLALRFLQLAGLLRPRWLVWENVPGVLSINGGRDFGSIVGGMAQLGYGWAYRVLDAQYVRVDSHAYAVPQRRRRVFVVGYLGDWRRSAAVLFERASLSGHPAPRREAGKAVGSLTSTGVGTCGGDDNQGQARHLIPSTGGVSHCLNAGGMGRIDYETETLVSHTLKGEGHDASEDGTGRGTPIVPLAFNHHKGGNDESTLGVQDNHTNALVGGHHPRADALHANQQPAVQQGLIVRRLTPIECERLQGFPDGYTNIPRNKRNPAAEHEGTVRYLLRTGQIERAEDAPTTTPDGPRYKALGKSMAVNVMRWIGLRIQSAEHHPNATAGEH